MVSIIQTSEEYAERFHQCLDAVARERRYLAFVEAPPVDGVRQFVRAIVAAKATQLLALDVQMVVGWCDILTKPMEGFTHVGTLGMGVLASHRRRGIGERLVRDALTHARAVGVERVELEVFASNTPAIALYEKLGFAHEGVKRGARKIDSIYDDVVLMAKT